MALIVLQSGPIPPGWFDSKDSDLSSFQGGEICTLTGVQYRGSGAGYDASTSLFDGYVGTTTKTRPAVTRRNLTANSRPLFLADDGTVGYGTLFGTVIGSMGGQVNGTVGLGIHSAAASGKITVHNEPAVYGVTLDSVDTATLNPTNAALTVGAPLYYTVDGLLTTATTLTTKVATFIEFASNGSLVNSSASMIQSLSSAGPGSIVANRFSMAMINFAPPSA